MSAGVGRVTLIIPVPLREFTDGRETLAVEALTVRDALAGAAAMHPQLLPRVLTPEGAPRPFVNLFVGETNIRTLEGLDTPLANGDELHIIAAVAGG